MINPHLPPDYAAAIAANNKFLGYPNITPRERIKRHAVLSENGEYRYTLERRDVTDDGNPRTLLAIGVNPSTADAAQDDPTIVRLYGFCRTLGYGHLLVVNKFARRSPDVKALRKAGDPIGKHNDTFIADAMKRADLVLACWGPLTKLPESLRGRWRDVVRLCDSAQQTIYCLGTAKDGHPRHPLMLSADTKLEQWPVPRFPWFLGRDKPGPQPCDDCKDANSFTCCAPDRQACKREQLAIHYGRGRGPMLVGDTTLVTTGPTKVIS